MRSVGTLRVAVAFAAACATRSPLRQDWVELRTPHFDILSSLSAAETQLSSDHDVVWAIRVENTDRP